MAQRSVDPGLNPSSPSTTRCWSESPDLPPRPSPHHHHQSCAQPAVIGNHRPIPPPPRMVAVCTVQLMCTVQHSEPTIRRVGQLIATLVPPRDLSSHVGCRVVRSVRRAGTSEAPISELDWVELVHSIRHIHSFREGMSKLACLSRCSNMNLGGRLNNARNWNFAIKFPDRASYDTIFFLK